MDQEMIARFLGQMLFCGGVLSVLYAPSIKPKEFQGAVTSVDYGRLKLVLGDEGQNTTFFVPADAKVTLNGCGADLFDLGAQQRTTILAKFSRGEWVALNVSATTQDHP
jgi:hypothetical protein